MLATGLYGMTILQECDPCDLFELLVLPWTFLWCLLRFPLWPNLLSHISHLKGRSPRWTVRLCLSRSHFAKNGFLQTSHAWGRCFWCTDRTCRCRLLLKAKTIWHWWQVRSSVLAAVALCLSLFEPFPLFPLLELSEVRRKWMSCLLIVTIKNDWSSWRTSKECSSSLFYWDRNLFSVYNLRIRTMKIRHSSSETNY